MTMLPIYPSKSYHLLHVQLLRHPRPDTHSNRCVVDRDRSLSFPDHLKRKPVCLMAMRPPRQSRRAFFLHLLSPDLN